MTSDDILSLLIGFLHFVDSIDPGVLGQVVVGILGLVTVFTLVANRLEALARVGLGEDYGAPPCVGYDQETPPIQDKSKTSREHAG